MGMKRQNNNLVNKVSFIASCLCEERDNQIYKNDGNIRFSLRISNFSIDEA